MDGYQLTAVIFQSIAKLGWPLAAWAIVWLFKDKLIELLPHARVKGKDWEASFRLEKAEAEAGRAQLPPVPAELAPAPEEAEGFEAVARASPLAAILETYSEVEEVIQEAAKRHRNALVTKIPTSTAGAIRQLRNTGVIDRPIGVILDNLRSIGNMARHGSGEIEFSAFDAHRFKELANQVIARIELLA